MAASSLGGSFSDFLGVLLVVAERVSTITRLIRSEQNLFKILVEEKEDKSKNEKFVHDFKTLADVLIQQIVKYYVGKEVMKGFFISCILTCFTASSLQ